MMTLASSLLSRIVAVLHFLPDLSDPQGIVATLAAALAPDSLLAISHLTADFAPEQVEAGVAVAG
jgi:hypothetical protein